MCWKSWGTLQNAVTTRCGGMVVSKNYHHSEWKKEEKLRLQRVNVERTTLHPASQHSFLFKLTFQKTQSALIGQRSQAWADTAMTAQLWHHSVTEVQVAHLQEQFQNLWIAPFDPFTVFLQNLKLLYDH